MSFLKFITPLSRLVGKVHAPFSERLINGGDFYAINEEVKTGDILLSRTRYHLTNIFIPGYFKHAALLTSNHEVIESTGKGVHLTSLYDFISTKDYLCLIRMNMLSETTRNFIANIALKQLGANYDYEFESKDKEFYCAELIYYAYLQANVKLLQPNKYITPMDIFKSELLNVVYLSDSMRKLCKE